MKKLVFAFAAVSALAVSAPAAAQYSNRYDNNADFSTRFDYRIDQLEDRLDSGIRVGEIDRRESRDLRRQIYDLNRLEAQYSANGLSNSERQELQRRIRDVRQNLRLADGRDDGWYDRNDRYGSWDRWDDDRYTGRGGPYEDADDYYACERTTRSGIGGVIDSVLGTNRCYGVGDRVSSTGLYAVPSAYRSQYRDGSGYYYRSDGQRIYRIDTRTNTVAGVYPMNR